MKTLIFLAILLASFQATALENGVFGAISQSENCCVDNQIGGVYFRAGDKIGGEIFATLSHVKGAAASFYIAENTSLGLGVYEEKYQEADRDDTSIGQLIYIQHNIDKYFARLTYTNNEFDLAGFNCKLDHWSNKRPCGRTEGDAKTVNNNSVWLWIGFRF